MTNKTNYDWEQRTMKMNHKLEKFRKRKNKSMRMRPQQLFEAMSMLLQCGALPRTPVSSGPQCIYIVCKHVRTLTNGGSSTDLHTDLLHRTTIPKLESQMLGSSAHHRSNITDRMTTQIKSWLIQVGVSPDQRKVLVSISGRGLP